MGSRRHNRCFYVRNRIKEVSDRSYIDPKGGTVDYVLLFIPNESIYSFLNQEENLGEIKVNISPTTPVSANLSKVICVEPFVDVTIPKK